MGVRLTWRSHTSLPVEAQGLLPDRILSLGVDEIHRLQMPVGNRSEELGDLFEVTIDASEDLTLEGELRHVQGIGRGLSQGRLVVHGSAGPWLGEGMTGGVLELHGEAGEGAGCGMRGGVLQIWGQAGPGLGGARPGDRHGMKDGLILVHGNAAGDLGSRMRRGLIAVTGSVGDYAGRAMIAGTIFACGGLGLHAGLGMKRGTIVSIGLNAPELLPTFVPTGAYRFPFLSMYCQELARHRIELPARLSSAEFARYNGDRAEGGQGEILVLGPGR